MVKRLILVALLLSLTGCSIVKFPCKSSAMKWRASIEPQVNQYQASYNH